MTSYMGPFEFMGATITLREHINVGLTFDVVVRLGEITFSKGGFRHIGTAKKWAEKSIRNRTAPAQERQGEL